MCPKKTEVPAAAPVDANGEPLNAGQIEAIAALQPVESSRFAKAGYSPEHRVLAIQFHGKSKGDDKTAGKIYTYADFEPTQYMELLEAESAGSWLIANVINRSDRHPYKLIS